MAAAIAVAALATALLVLTSVQDAYPGVGLLREARSSRAAAMFEAEAKYVPRGVASRFDIHYDRTPGSALDSHLTLNAFWPATTPAREALPTVVWIHGGGWIGGGASELTSHLKIVARHGYTTIGVNYTLAPTTHYPTPVKQVMKALAFVTGHAAALHVDPARLVLAGDSAGAQIAAQVTAMIERPAYAAQVGVTPTLAPGAIRAVVLYCGVYDWALPGVRGSFRTYLENALLLYTGSTHPSTVPRLRTGSVVHYVPRGFPPAFVTAGNADPVLPLSTAFAAALQAKGVRVDPLFFPRDFKPGLPHEYEFYLGTSAGRLALARTLAFLHEYDGSVPA